MHETNLTKQIEDLLFKEDLVISDELVGVWYPIVSKDFGNKQEFKEFLEMELIKYKNGGK
ncbi:hypothetical protein U8V72_14880 [Priestia filamentosa]|uniref:hypothetical protein n=1 Tax=Priestia filamentosa TaxID=1402861 RepID=UPI000588EFF6